SPELHRRAGRLWQEMGNATQALAHYRLAVQSSNDLEFLRRVTDMLLERGDFALARDLLDEMLQLSPDDAWAHYHQGLLLAATDPLQAESHLREIARHPVYGDFARELLAVVTRDYDAPQLSTFIADALVEAEHWAYAEQAFLYAATWNHPFPEALAYAGLMRDFQGKNGDEQLTSALAMAPDNVEVLLLMGMHLRLRRNPEDSEQVLRYALGFAPDNPILYAELGKTYQQTGRLDEAQAALQRAVALSGNAEALQITLAQFYAEEAYRLPEEVLNDLARQRDENPDDPTALARYAWALHLQGDSEGASQQLEAALALDPDNPDAQFNKARILLDSGLQDAAIDILADLADGTSLYAGTAQAMLQNLR
ncbi:MAG: tetratricopeptide repeat protein, partial [Aggregatilineales bacterium]